MTSKVNQTPRWVTTHTPQLPTYMQRNWWRG